MGLRDLLRRRRPPGWLDPGEPWAVQAMRDSRGAEAWADLIEHAATLNQAKPTIKWRKQAALLVAAAGRDEVRDALARWFALVGQDARGPIAEPNASVLRGLAWYPVVLEDESLAAPLGELADACFRKIPDVGARSVKAGNAALAALAELPGTAGAAQLGRMRSRLKLPSAQERVAAAMGTAAERAGVSPDELEELAVPDVRPRPRLDAHEIARRVRRRALGGRGCRAVVAAGRPHAEDDPGGGQARPRLGAGRAQSGPQGAQGAAARAAGAARAAAHAAARLAAGDLARALPRPPASSAPSPGG